MDGIDDGRSPAAADQQVEFQRRRDGEEVRLHGERHARHQADRDGRPRPSATPSARAIEAIM